MGGRKKRIVIATAIVVAVIMGIGEVSNLAYADFNGPTTSVASIGLLQVGAHDLFNVNRCLDSDRMLLPPEDCTVEDFENGKLDLSTLLVDTANGGTPFSDDEIKMGGEARNRENIGIATASSMLGEIYVYLKDKYGEEIAYEKTLEIYHKTIKQEFQRTFHQPFPAPQDGDVDANHNLALRTVHDVLPGNVKFHGEMTNIFLLTGEVFDKKGEFRQPTSVLDGQFDEEFLGIDICLPNSGSPPICIQVDLLEADQDFGTQFDTDFSFDYLMTELSDGKYDKNDEVTKLIVELFARGINF